MSVHNRHVRGVSQRMSDAVGFRRPSGTSRVPPYNPVVWRIVTGLAVTYPCRVAQR
ncbi:hypothetical protein ABZW30_38755 [Kitasatospora sp. NPDC004669]|uniref:hypothetical protein n=1 Tax=Kitasatospora sp. NPDC004669 TaxID=3154555 RepID=UPI0033B37F07